MKKENKQQKKLGLLTRLIFQAVYRFSDKKNITNPTDKKVHKKNFLALAEEKYRQAVEEKRIDYLEKKALKNKKTRQLIEKFHELFPAAEPMKSLDQMNSQEFYDYLLNYQSESYLDFLFDYITTAYLEGDLSAKDIATIVNAPSATEIKNYIDSKLTDIKYHYSMAEEILKYQDQGSQLLKEILPTNKKTAKYKIKTIENLKRILSDNFTDFENMKKQLAKAKMIKSENERLAKQRKMILANAPEALELVKNKDKYDSTQESKQKLSTIIDTESQKEEKKKVLLRRANRQLTPSQLIAEKKRLINQLNQKQSGLNLKT